jgi:hypothetical protein
VIATTDTGTVLLSSFGAAGLTAGFAFALQRWTLARQDARDARERLRRGAEALIYAATTALAVIKRSSYLFAGETSPQRDAMLARGLREALERADLAIAALLLESGGVDLVGAFDDVLTAVNNYQWALAENADAPGSVDLKTLRAGFDRAKEAVEALPARLQALIGQP